MKHYAIKALLILCISVFIDQCNAAIQTPSSGKDIIDRSILQAGKAKSQEEKEKLFTAAASDFLNLVSTYENDVSEKSLRVYLTSTIVNNFEQKFRAGYNAQLENEKGEIENSLKTWHKASKPPSPYSIHRLFRNFPKKPSVNPKAHQDILLSVNAIVLRFVKLWEGAGFKWIRGDSNVNEFSNILSNLYREEELDESEMEYYAKIHKGLNPRLTSNTGGGDSSSTAGTQRRIRSKFDGDSVFNRQELSWLRRNSEAAKSILKNSAKNFFQYWKKGGIPLEFYKQGEYRQRLYQCLAEENTNCNIFVSETAKQLNVPQSDYEALAYYTRSRTPVHDALTISVAGGDDAKLTQIKPYVALQRVRKIWRKSRIVGNKVLAKNFIEQLDSQFGVVEDDSSSSNSIFTQPEMTLPTTTTTSLSSDSIEESILKAKGHPNKQNLFKNAATQLLTFAFSLPYDSEVNEDWIDPSSKKPGSEELYLAKLFVIKFSRTMVRGYKKSFESVKGEVEYELRNSNDDSRSIKELFQLVPKNPRMNPTVHKEISTAFNRVITKFIRLWSAAGFEWNKRDSSVRELNSVFNDVYVDMKERDKSSFTVFTGTTDEQSTIAFSPEQSTAVAQPSLLRGQGGASSSPMTIAEGRPASLSMVQQRLQRNGDFGTIKNSEELMTLASQLQQLLTMAMEKNGNSPEDSFEPRSEGGVKVSVGSQTMLGGEESILSPSKSESTLAMKEEDSSLETESSAEEESLPSSSSKEKESTSNELNASSKVPLWQKLITGKIPLNVFLMLLIVSCLLWFCGPYNNKNTN